MSDASVIAAAKEFIPIRIDQVKDAALWKRYGIQGIGMFLVLTNEGEEHATVSMKSALPKDIVKSFTTTLPKAWNELKDGVKRVEWAASLSAAQQAAASSAKPIALLLVKRLPAKKRKDAGDPALDAKSLAAEESLGARAVAPHYERFHWVRVVWDDALPAEAKALSVSRAPTLALLDPSGAKVWSRLTKFQPDKLAAALDKYATKAEQAAAKSRAKQAK